MKLFNFFTDNWWMFCCIACVIWVVVILNKDTDEIKRFDVDTYADKEEMKRRLKQSLKNKGGGDVDIKGKKSGFTAENDEFFADVIKGPRTKGK